MDASVQAGPIRDGRIRRFCIPSYNGCKSYLMPLPFECGLNLVVSGSVVCPRSTHERVKLKRLRLKQSPAPRQRKSSRLPFSRTCLRSASTRRKLRDLASGHARSCRSPLMTMVRLPCLSNLRSCSLIAPIGKVPTVGRLLALDKEQVVIEIRGTAGTFHCHFPRLYYVVQPEPSSKL